MHTHRTNSESSQREGFGRIEGWQGPGLGAGPHFDPWAPRRYKLLRWETRGSQRLKRTRVIGPNFGIKRASSLGNSRLQGGAGGPDRGGRPAQTAQGGN
jgi:hypothetical protein